MIKTDDNQNLAVIEFIKKIYNEDKFIPLHEPRFSDKEKI